MKTVDKKKEIYLKEKFPKIVSDALFPEDEEKWSHPLYNLFFLSVFDHWLTEKEAEPEIFCYSQIEKNISQEYNQEVQIYFERENRLLKFYQNLFDSHVLYMHKGIELNTDKFYQFDNFREYEKKCLRSIREKEFIRLCVPELNLVLNGGFDLTHKIFLYKNYPIDRVKDLATSCGLFILS